MRKYLAGLAVLFIVTSVLAVRQAWANSVRLTSTCGQVQVVNDPRHNRVTLSQNGVVHYTFKKDGVYDVAPGTYFWQFIHGTRPNGDQGTITVPSCEPTTTTTLAPTTTTTDAPTTTSTTIGTAVTSTTTTVPVTTTTECQDHTLPCAGPPVTFPVHPINHPPTVQPAPTPVAVARPPFTG